MLQRITRLPGLPFGAFVCEGLLDPVLLRAASLSVPSVSWKEWISYESPFEHGKLTAHPTTLPQPLTQILQYLESDTFIRFISELLGLSLLVVDPMGHGAGLHSSGSGAYLDVHLDYSRHPVLSHLERRVNVVLFLNEVWEDSWGGELCFTDDLGSRTLVSVLPGFGRMVIWEPTDLAYHGHPEPLKCPVNVRRNSLATYYLAPARESSVRKRALFVPRRTPR